MNQTEWLNALAAEMNGWYDEEDNTLCVDPGDGFGCKTYAFGEILQLYNSKMSPREAADILRMGGVE